MSDSKGKLIIALMYSNKEILEKTIKELINNFGEIEDKISYKFDFTDYYEKEFGKNLIKKIIVFKKIINKKDLAEIKLFTNNLENTFKKNNKRLINIDPGYLSKEELILVSNKEKSYKEKIAEGIFAHKVLEFKDDEVNTFFHTFPDYKQEKIGEFLINLAKSI